MTSREAQGAGEMLGDVVGGKSNKKKQDTDSQKVEVGDSHEHMTPAALPSTTAGLHARRYESVRSNLLTTALKPPRLASTL